MGNAYKKKTFVLFAQRIQVYTLLIPPNELFKFSRQCTFKIALRY